MTSKFFSLTAYLIAFFLIFCAVLATILSYLLNDLKYYTELTFELFENKTGYAVTLDDINWSLRRGAGIQISNVTIMDKARGTVLFKGKKVHILTELLPLLKKHLVVSRIFIYQPELSVARDASGTWMSLTLPVPAWYSSGQEDNFFDFEISLKKLFIENGLFTYCDMLDTVSFNLSRCELELQRVLGTHNFIAYASAQSDIGGKTGSAEIQSTLFFTPQSPASKLVSIQGSLVLDSLSVSPLLPYIRRMAPLDDLSSRLSASIDFRLRPDFSFAAQGDLICSDLTVSPDPDTLASLGTCTIRASLQGTADAVHCKKLSLVLPAEAVLDGSFTVTGIGSGTPTLSLNMASRQLSVASISEYLDRTGVVPDRYRRYLGQCDGGGLSMDALSFKGPLSASAAEMLPKVQAGLTLHDLTIRSTAGLPPVRIPGARIQLDNATVTIHASAACFDNDTHTLRGCISSVFSQPDFSAAIDSHIPALPVSRLLPAAAIQIPSGSLSAQTRITATGEAGTFRTSVNLTEAACRLPGLLQKPPGIPCNVTLKGMLPFADPSAALSCALSVDEKLSLSGSVTGRNPLAIAGTYAFNSIDLASFEFPALPPSLQISGRCSGRGTFRYPAGGSSLLPLSGSFDVDDFRLSERSEARTLINVGLKTHLADTAVIENGYAHIGRTRFTASGLLTDILPPRGRLAAVASFFDIDDFVATVVRIKNHLKNGRPKPRTTKKNIFLETFLDTELTVEKVNFLSWDFDNGTTLYTYRNGVMCWDDIHIAAGGGTVHGTVVYDFKNRNKKKLELLPSNSDVDVTWAIPAFSKSRTVTGTMDLNGSFSSVFRKKHEIAPNMQGSFHVSIADGSIRKFNVISKILHMLDIRKLLQLQVPDLSIEGIPFDTIQSSFSMKKGVMETQDFVLKGPAMNLSAVGSIHTVEREIDFTIGAQPLRTIGTILGNIPIARDVLTGKDKSLTVGYFQVKGPYDDPSVKALPLTSINRAVFKVFKTILDIPRDIILHRNDNSSMQHSPPSP